MFCPPCQSGIEDFVNDHTGLKTALTGAKKLQQFFHSNKVWRAFVTFCEKNFPEVDLKGIPGYSPTRWWTELRLAKGRKAFRGLFSSCTLFATIVANKRFGFVLNRSLS